MKRSTGLFDRLVDEDELDRALLRVTRGRRRAPEAAWLLMRRRTALRELVNCLRSGAWRHGPFRLLYLTHPKPRVIALAAIEDRWIQAAAARILTPTILRSAEHASYGGRPGGGAQRATLALLRSMRCYRFAVHLDIRSFFPSVDPRRVRQLLTCRISDERFLAVVDQILERGRGLFDGVRARRHARIDPDWPPPGRGLPLGAATSQLFAAHLYLEQLDRYVKRELRLPAYVRYVDDLFLFGDRRGDLRRWRGAVAAWLLRERELRLKHPEARVVSCRGHLDALGRRIHRSGVEACDRGWRRAGERIGRVVERRVGGDAEDDLASLTASFGHLFHL